MGSCTLRLLCILGALLIRTVYNVAVHLTDLITLSMPCDHEGPAESMVDEVEQWSMLLLLAIL